MYAHFESNEFVEMLLDERDRDVANTVLLVNNDSAKYFIMCCYLITLRFLS